MSPFFRRFSHFVILNLKSILIFNQIRCIKYAESLSLKPIIYKLFGCRKNKDSHHRLFEAQNCEIYNRPGSLSHNFSRLKWALSGWRFWHASLIILSTYALLRKGRPGDPLWHKNGTYVRIFLDSSFWRFLKLNAAQRHLLIDIKLPSQAINAFIWTHLINSCESYSRKA